MQPVCVHICSMSMCVLASAGEEIDRTASKSCLQAMGKLKRNSNQTRFSVKESLAVKNNFSPTKNYCFVPQQKMLDHEKKNDCSLNIDKSGHLCVRLFEDSGSSRAPILSVFFKKGFLPPSYPLHMIRIVIRVLKSLIMSVVHAGQVTLMTGVGDPCFQLSFGANVSMNGHLSRFRYTRPTIGWRAVQSVSHLLPCTPSLASTHLGSFPAQL